MLRNSQIRTRRNLDHIKDVKRARIFDLFMGSLCYSIIGSTFIVLVLHSCDVLEHEFADQWIVKVFVTIFSLFFFLGYAVERQAIKQMRKAELLKVFLDDDVRRKLL